MRKSVLSCLTPLSDRVRAGCCCVCFLFIRFRETSTTENTFPYECPLQPISTPHITEISVLGIFRCLAMQRILLCLPSRLLVGLRRWGHLPSMCVPFARGVMTMRERGALSLVPV